MGRFASDGSRIGRVGLGNDDAPPYGLDLVQVAEGVFFIAWQTGENPNYRVVGQFVEL